MRIIARIFYWDDDQSVCMFIYRQNIDEEKYRENQLMELMQRDSMTGLYNKISAQEHIQSRLINNNNMQYAFFILNIDNFKQVNDVCGHAVGDKVIEEFANILKNQFDSDDIIGHIGGDEFVVLAPSYSREYLEKKAKNLNQALRYDYVDRSGRCRISASIGIAVFPGSGENFETLYRNADTARYNAKGKGKNTYAIA